MTKARDLKYELNIDSELHDYYTSLREVIEQDIENKVQQGKSRSVTGVPSNFPINAISSREARIIILHKLIQHFRDLHYKVKVQQTKSGKEYFIVEWGIKSFYPEFERMERYVEKYVNKPPEVKKTPPMLTAPNTLQPTVVNGSVTYRHPGDVQLPPPVPTPESDLFKNTFNNNIRYKPGNNKIIPPSPPEPEDVYIINSATQRQHITDPGGIHDYDFNNPDWMSGMLHNPPGGFPNVTHARFIPPNPQSVNIRGVRTRQPRDPQRF